MIRRIGFLLLFPIFVTYAASAQVVENADLRLEVSPQTGSIIHLFDKRNQTAKLAVDLVESLFGKSTLMR